MTACERKVFPAKVIARVTAEIEKVEGNEPFPKKFFLSETMKRSRLKDTTLIEITIHGINRTNQQILQESDVLRGREVLNRHKGRVGSIALVVRRPG